MGDEGGGTRRRNPSGAAACPDSIAHTTVPTNHIFTQKFPRLCACEALYCSPGEGGKGGLGGVELSSAPKELSSPR